MGDGIRGRPRTKLACKRAATLKVETMDGCTKIKAAAAAVAAEEGDSFLTTSETSAANAADASRVVAVARMAKRERRHRRETGQVFLSSILRRRRR